MVDTIAEFEERILKIKGVLFFFFFWKDVCHIKLVPKVQIL